MTNESAPAVEAGTALSEALGPWKEHQQKKGKNHIMPTDTTTGKLAGKPKPQSPAEILAARKARLEGLAAKSAVAESGDLEAALNDQREQEAVLRKERDDIQNALGVAAAAMGEAMVLAARARIHEIDVDLEQIGVNIADMGKMDGATMAALIVKTAIELRLGEGPRQALRKLDAETAKAGDIAAIIGEAEKISAIKVAGKPEDGTTPFFEWGGAVYVPQVQKSKKARDFVGEVRSFITRFAEAREASREAYREQVAPYMIGTKRRGGADKNLPSEHQALRHAKDTLRAGAALTRFLDGEGARVFVPVVLDKRGGAKPETVGELLLERDSENEKRPVIRRIVGRAFLAKLVFAKTDRVTKEVTGWVHEVRVEFAPKPSEELRRELAKKGQEPFLFRGPITVAQALTRRFIAEEAAVSRDKALALLAKEYKAKTLTAKNAAKFAAETGGEGTYALPLNWNRAPAGIVVKKTKAGVLALIASTDVSVERLFRTESEEEEPSNHKMGELSGKMKALMRSALWEVGVLRDDVPAHLQPESRERE